MVKRLFDIVASLLGLLVLSPLLMGAAIGIRLTSPGPVFYRARRTGRCGHEFVMHKFRTMRLASGSSSLITTATDPRVFPLGQLLRLLKIDELPQLYDVLTGKMSVVGPRPEDPRIVDRYYGPLGRETLNVVPGLVSYGSLYNYTHGQRHLNDSDPETSYVRELLPLKLALELVYVRNHSLPGDLTIIVKTFVTIFLISLGKRNFSEPSEIIKAREILDSDRGLVVVAG